MLLFPGVRCCLLNTALHLSACQGTPSMLTVPPVPTPGYPAVMHLSCISALPSGHATRCSRLLHPGVAAHPASCRVCSGGLPGQPVLRGQGGGGAQLLAQARPLRRIRGGGAAAQPPAALREPCRPGQPDPHRVVRGRGCQPERAATWSRVSACWWCGL